MAGTMSRAAWGVFVGRGSSVDAGDGIAGAVTGSFTVGSAVGKSVGFFIAGVGAGPVYPELSALPVLSQ